MPSPASPCNEEEHLDEDLQAVQAVPVVISPPSAVLDRPAAYRGCSWPLVGHGPRGRASPLQQHRARCGGYRGVSCVVRALRSEVSVVAACVCARARDGWGARRV